MVVDHNVLYFTNDGKYIPAVYPKSWPYALYRKEGSHALSVDVGSYETFRVPGVWFAPASLPVNNHLYHNLLDNLARLYFLRELRLSGLGDVPIAWPSMGDLGSDMEIIQKCFVGDGPFQIFPKGIYEFERLIIPPLANRNDYMFSDTTNYLRDRLLSLVKNGHQHFQTRIYVSRADTKTRNMANDAEISCALRKLGFMTMCPGDYSIRTQLEIFAAAEIVVGIHGMGLMPILVSGSARRCWNTRRWDGTRPLFVGWRIAWGCSMSFFPVKRSTMVPATACSTGAPKPTLRRRSRPSGASFRSEHPVGAAFVKVPLPDEHPVECLRRLARRVTSQSDTEIHRDGRGYRYAAASRAPLERIRRDWTYKAVPNAL